MTNNQVIRILREFNKWRRGEIEDIIEDVYTVGQAIDFAIEKLAEIDKLFEETNNQRYGRQED